MFISRSFPNVTPLWLSLQAVPDRLNRHFAAVFERLRTLIIAKNDQELWAVENVHGLHVKGLKYRQKTKDLL